MPVLAQHTGGHLANCQPINTFSIQNILLNVSTMLLVQVLPMFKVQEDFHI